MDLATAPPSALDRTRAWLLLANLLLAGLLTASGLLLLVLYTPGSALAVLHRLGGRALLVTAAMSLLLHVIPRARRATAVAAAGLLAAGAVAQASGPLVAWRTLAVWAVAVEAGRSVRGYLWAVGDNVRFVVVDGTELEPATVVVPLLLHLGAGMVTGVAALGVLATGRRFSR